MSPDYKSDPHRRRRAYPSSRKDGKNISAAGLCNPSCVCHKSLVSHSSLALTHIGLAADTT